MGPRYGHREHWCRCLAGRSPPRSQGAARREREAEDEDRGPGIDEPRQHEPFNARPPFLVQLSPGETHTAPSRDVRQRACGSQPIVCSSGRRASVATRGPRGLWLSYDAQRVDDTIEMGDSARDPVYQPAKGDGANRPSCCRPVELDATRVARPVRGRLVGVTLSRRVRDRDQSQRSIPWRIVRSLRKAGDRDMPWLRR